MKRLVRLFLALCALFSISIRSDAEEVLTMGRIYPYMPKVTVELYGAGDAKAEDIRAMIGERRLSVEDIHIYEKSRDSAKIYLLADVSTSMAGRLDILKPELHKVMEAAGAGDEIVLLSFGEEVKQVLAGTESREQRIQAVDQLSPTEEGTVLYKALSMAYDMSMNVQSDFDREYIYLITDGIDFQKGNQTYAEIAKKFQGHVLPIYALCTENVTQEAADTLGELSRLSGGEYQMIKEGREGESFDIIRRRIDSAALLSLKAATNEISGQEELFSLQVGDKAAENRIEVNRFIADHEPPVVEECRIEKGNRKISVQFSEPVMYGEAENALRLADGNGDSIVMKKTEYIEDVNTVYLYPEFPLEKGAYYLKLQGITDISQEKNVLADQEIELNAGSLGQQKKESRSAFYIIIGIVILTVLLAAIGILSYRKTRKKKQKTKEERQEVDPSGKIRLNEVESSRPVEKEIYHIKQASGRKLHIQMRLADGTERRITVNAAGSLIFGRGKNCDVIIEDERMSRQHFAVELEDERMVIMDLESTCGTKVNGVPLKGRRVLKPEERIRAGQTEFRIME